MSKSKPQQLRNDGPALAMSPNSFAPKRHKETCAGPLRAKQRTESHAKHRFRLECDELAIVTSINRF